LRDQSEFEDKKTFNSQTGMKASTIPPKKQFGDWPHPSLAEKLSSFPDDERNRTGILTFGFKPHSAFPLPVALEFVAVTWRNPSESHRIPDIRWHGGKISFAVSKNASVLRRKLIFAKKNLCQFFCRPAPPTILGNKKRRENFFGRN